VYSDVIWKGISYGSHDVELLNCLSTDQRLNRNPVHGFDNSSIFELLNVVAILLRTLTLDDSHRDCRYVPFVE